MSRLIHHLFSLLEVQKQLKDIFVHSAKRFLIHSPAAHPHLTPSNTIFISLSLLQPEHGPGASHSHPGLHVVDHCNMFFLIAIVQLVFTELSWPFFSWGFPFMKLDFLVPFNSPMLCLFVSCKCLLKVPKMVGSNHHNLWVLFESKNPKVFKLEWQKTS